jgi:hypothetical protein
MNPPSMEAIFLILSGVILLAGIFYWLWSHIQLTQKKVLLIENSVHELRDILSKRVAPPEPMMTEGNIKLVSATTTAPVYNDLSDDDWANEDGTTNADSDIKTVPMVSTPLDALDEIRHDVVVTYAERLTPDSRAVVSTEEEFNTLTSIQEVDELQPGGRILSGNDAAPDDKEFRELFAARTPEDSATSSASTTAGSTLESMSVKELRRIAEQRGIARAGEMRKRELLAALREQGTPANSTLDGVFVERVMDEEAVPVLE